MNTELIRSCLKKTGIMRLAGAGGLVLVAVICAAAAEWLSPEIALAIRSNADSISTLALVAMSLAVYNFDSRQIIYTPGWTKPFLVAFWLGALGFILARMFDFRGSAGAGTALVLVALASFSLRAILSVAIPRDYVDRMLEKLKP